MVSRASAFLHRRISVRSGVSPHQVQPPLPRPCSSLPRQSLRCVWDPRRGVHPHLPAPGHRRRPPAPGHRRRPPAPRGEDTLSSVRVRPGCLTHISGRCPCSPADSRRCAAHRLRGEQAVTDRPAPPGVRRRTMRILRIRRIWGDGAGCACGEVGGASVYRRKEHASTRYWVLAGRVAQTVRVGGGDTLPPCGAQRCADGRQHVIGGSSSPYSRARPGPRRRGRPGVDMDESARRHASAWPRRQMRDPWRT
jgi:hypothetical protein